MELIKFYLLIIFTLSFLIHGTHGSNEGYYLVFINNTDNDSKNHKRQENNEVIQKIHSLIVENKNTYQDAQKLMEIEEQHSQLSKRNKVNYGDSNLVYTISSVKNKSVALAYLSPFVATKVQKLPNVLECNPDSKIELTSYYNTNDLKEIERITQWKGVSVREDTDIHLSLISERLANTTSTTNQYDDNYYYPKSAGEDIDMIIVDSGFNFKHAEFSNKDERTTKCLAEIVDGKPDLSISEDKCSTKDEVLLMMNAYHGEWSSDVAAGLKHGVANKANIYGVTIPSVSRSNLIGALQYVVDNLKRPHKTVINLSIGYFYDKKDESKKEEINHLKSLIDEIIEKGGIVVAGAGNDGKNSNSEEEMFLPCAFDNVICVGAIDNSGLNFKSMEQYDQFFVDETKNNPKYYNEDIIDSMNFINAIENQTPDSPQEESTENLEVDVNLDPELDDEDSLSDSEYFKDDTMESYIPDDSNTTMDINDDEEITAHPETNQQFPEELRNRYHQVELHKNKILYDYYMESMKNKTVPYRYRKAFFSNYGTIVDIYAPGFFYGEYQDIESQDKFIVSLGTSFATPVVTGVVATIMSDHPEIEFTQEKMKNYLIEIALKDVVEGIPEGPNHFIQNFKRYDTIEN